jgi:hypothetical protein
VLLTNLNPNRIIATIGIPMKRESHVVDLLLKKLLYTCSTIGWFWNKISAPENAKEKIRKSRIPPNKMQKIPKQLPTNLNIPVITRIKKSTHLVMKI